MDLIERLSNACGGSLGLFIYLLALCCFIAFFWGAVTGNLSCGG